MLGLGGRPHDEHDVCDFPTHSCRPMADRLLPPSALRASEGVVIDIDHVASANGGQVSQLATRLTMQLSSIMSREQMVARTPPQAMHWRIAQTRRLAYGASQSGTITRRACRCR